MRNMCVAYDEDQEDQTHSGKSMHSGAQRPAQCANADWHRMQTIARMSPIQNVQMYI